MGKRFEIPVAFCKSIKHESNGRRTVSTVDFVAELALVNHHYSLKEANQWIEDYQSSFRDVSKEEGERRIFQLYNPNGAVKF